MEKYKLNINGGTMKLSVITIAFLISLMTIPLMDAATFNETTVNIKVIPTTDAVNSSIINLRLELRNTIASQNNKDFTMRLVKNSTEDMRIEVVGSPSVKDKTLSYIFGYISEGGVVTLNASDALSLKKCFDDLTVCKSSVNGYSNSYNVCNNLIGNQTRLNNRLNTCNVTIMQNNVDLAAKDDKIASIQTESDAVKNQKWTFGVGGLIVGILGLLFYQGKLGSTSREKSMGEFNKGNAG